MSCRPTHTTDALGRFRTTLPLGRAVTLRTGERLHFTLGRPGSSAPLHTPKPIPLSGLTGEPLSLEIPEAACARGLTRPAIGVYVDDRPARTIAIGQSVAIDATGVRPNSTYELSFTVKRGTRHPRRGLGAGVSWLPLADGRKPGCVSGPALLTLGLLLLV